MSNEYVKKCPDCEKTLPVSEFDCVRKNNKTFVKSHCRDCWREYARLWYQKNANRINKRNVLKYSQASEAEKEKKRKKWRNEKRRESQEVKSARQKRMREYLKNNPQKRKEYYKNTRENRERQLKSMSATERELFLEKERKARRKLRQLRQARERGASVFVEFTKEDIVRRDGLICYLCGKVLKITKVTLDHILPLARGGQHKPENVKIACKSCNSSKNSKTLTEYKKYRGDYDRFLLSRNFKSENQALNSL